MKKVLSLSRYHWLVVFALCGVFGVILAFSTYNLFHYTMANFSFIQQHGFVAVMEGALWQSLQILANGSVALGCYIGFKICESDLVSRYKEWRVD